MGYIIAVLIAVIVGIAWADAIASSDPMMIEYLKEVDSYEEVE